MTFSGHGTFVPDQDGDEADGSDEAICPHDVVAGGPITDDELFELYSVRSYGSRLIVISDSCHSGTVTRFAPIRTPPTARGKRPPRRTVRFMPPATFLSARAASRLPRLHKGSPPGRYAALLLAGCQDWEYSYDAWFRGRPNGAFSYVALRALEALPAGETYAAWQRLIRSVLPSQQYPQTPNLYGTKHRRSWPALA